MPVRLILDCLTVPKNGGPLFQVYLEHIHHTIISQSKDQNSCTVYTYNYKDGSLNQYYILYITKLHVMTCVSYFPVLTGSMCGIVVVII